MFRIDSLNVSSLCLGGNVFGWTADEHESEAILDAFVAGGGNFIDTADLYSSSVPGHRGGESEQIIGIWLRKRGKHDDLVIATKAGKHPLHRGLRPSNLRICLDGSRRRLGIETIDLYYTHADDPSVPIVEWVGEFTQMIKQGEIRHYGLSNFTAERVSEVIEVAKAEGLASPVALQPGYNLVHRAEVESSGLGALAAEHGLVVVAYYGLAAGFLTGKYQRDAPIHGARAATVKRYATEAGFAVVDQIVRIANAMDVEPATIALAWLRHQPGVIPIASASTVEQVDGLLQAMKLKLSPTRLEKLSKISQPFA